MMAGDFEFLREAPHGFFSTATFARNFDRTEFMLAMRVVTVLGISRRP
jgi:hypothetical protein